MKNMKKFWMILLLALSSVTLSAQKLEVDAELSGVLGMDNMQGCKYAGQLKLTAGVEGLGLKGLMVGAGVGFDYASVLAGRWFVKADGSGNTNKDTFVYQTEYLLPVFARLKYTFYGLNLAPYILVDGGYSFNVGGQKSHDYSLPIEDGEIGGMPLNYEGRAKGLYLQPQIGVHLSDRLYLGLGFMMQAYTQYIVGYSTLDALDRNYETQTHSEEMTRSNYFNALSLHLGIKF
jgi:hypothetical protein